MEELFGHIKVELVAGLVFLISYLTSFLLIPRLIKIVEFKKLMDDPDERSSHTHKTPTLGGAVFYISLIFGLFTIHFFEFDGYGFNIVVGMTILFFVGLKDDLMVLSPITKLWAQLFAVSFVLLIPDLWISSFEGFLWIGDIPLGFSIAFSCFVMVFIINAYNLIDGIDGLAGLLGSMMFLIFAVFFYFTAHSFYFLLSVLGIGFLVAFLRFNFSKKEKIFMGDTGSLIVGFLLAILCIRFLALQPLDLFEISINASNKFLVTLSILFFPIIDVARVVIIRLLNKRGPFSPDRCHMHHILIDKGISHKKASITLIICGFVIFSIIFLINTYFYWKGLIFIFIILAFMTFTILLLLDQDEHVSSYRKRIKSLFPRSIQVLEFKIRKWVIVRLKRLFYKDMLNKRKS